MRVLLIVVPAPTLQWSFSEVVVTFPMLFRCNKQDDGTMSKAPPKEEFSDDDEKKETQSIFKMAGIDCIHSVTIREPKTKTEVDVLGVHARVVVLIQCVGKASFGPKIGHSITHLQT